MVRAPLGELLLAQDRELVAADLTAGGSGATLGVIIPEKLLQFECRGARGALLASLSLDSQASHGRSFCGCLDLGQHGRRVLKQRTLADLGSVLCLISGPSGDEPGGQQGGAHAAFDVAQAALDTRPGRLGSRAGLAAARRRRGTRASTY